MKDVVCSLWGFGVCGFRSGAMLHQDLLIKRPFGLFDV